MVTKYRKKFNSEFSDKKYLKVQELIEKKSGVKAGFRICESPIFLPESFRKKLIDVSETIVAQIKNMSESELVKAIPSNHNIPNDTSKPQLLAIDFGICRDEDGEISPQLIELQGFPSLFGYKKFFEEIMIEVYPFLDEVKNQISTKDYTSKFKEIILGDENPENVILLEIYPEKQKTYIDFAVTQNMLGIPIICLTKVKKEGKKLYYEKDGKKIPIHRIYNRVIFDELDKIPNLKLEFDFNDEVDVEWVPHPNWFFKISKYIMPRLSHKYIPKCYFLNEFPDDEKLENYVLKPLFSFAGSGVNLYPTREIIDAIPDKENFIMQRKVKYEPLFEDINGGKASAEIRMLMFWGKEDKNPVWVNNLVRMTKAEMVNVDFNKKGDIWIGSSYAFFTPG